VKISTSDLKIVVNLDGFNDIFFIEPKLGIK